MAARNYFYRRWPIANAILRIVKQQQPQAIEQLCADFYNVWGPDPSDNDEASEAISRW